MRFRCKLGLHKFRYFIVWFPMHPTEVKECVLCKRKFYA